MDSKIAFNMEQYGAMAGAARLTQQQREARLRARFLRLLHKKTKAKMAQKFGISPQRWATYENSGQPMRDPVKDMFIAKTPGMEAPFLKDGNPRYLSMELAERWADFLASGGKLSPELDNGS